MGRNLYPKRLSTPRRRGRLRNVSVQRRRRRDARRGCFDGDCFRSLSALSAVGRVRIERDGNDERDRICRFAATVPNHATGGRLGAGGREGDVGRDRARRRDEKLRTNPNRAVFIEESQAWRARLHSGDDVSSRRAAWRRMYFEARAGDRRLRGDDAKACSASQ